MKRFIVIDKQEGFSWINHSIEEVIRSVGHEGETWDEVSGKINFIYEVIEINGEGEFSIKFITEDEINYDNDDDDYHDNCL